MDTIEIESFPLDLVELDLSQNRLRDLDVLTFKQMSHLKSLDLYKNNLVSLQTLLL